MLRDRCTVSVDSSGALLHRRGYRQATAKAPLRETLAAAMLLGSGWTPDRPLLDPFCGAGTVAIEAAMIARGIAPGLLRAARPDGFAFMQWPGFDATLWERLTSEAREAVRPAAAAPIVASDRDAGAIEAARANAERAGVQESIALEQRTLSAVPPLPTGGWIVTNPPYGARLGDRGPLRALYARLGAIAASLEGWSLALLSGDPMLEGQLALPLAERWRSSNGGIPVRLAVYVAE
jgi:putative N6-adenine-specific DNA methylase